MLIQIKDGHAIEILNGKDIAGSTPLHYASAYHGSKNDKYDISRLLFKYSHLVDWNMYSEQQLSEIDFGNNIDEVENIVQYYGLRMAPIMNACVSQISRFGNSGNTNSNSNVAGNLQSVSSVTPLRKSLIQWPQYTT